MYGVLLLLHSWNRWIVLGLLVVVLVKALKSLSAGGELPAPDLKLARITAVIVDIQVVFGLLLHGVFSPVTKAAFGNMGEAMKDRVLRFWAVEHVTLMLVAWILIRVGTIIAKRPGTRAPGKKLAVFVGIALLLILAAIPWPGMPTERPLFRI